MYHLLRIAWDSHLQSTPCNALRSPGAPEKTMPSAITSGAPPSFSTAYGAGAPSAASLQAQLQRYQQKLSDCVNCASAKTPEGKANIEAISTQISQIEQRIAQSGKTRADPPGLAQGAPAVQAAPAAPQPSGIGSLINVFA